MQASKVLAFLSIVFASSLFVPATVLAQDDASPPLLTVTHCMKSSSSAYQGVESDIWLPMHQQRVNEGTMNSWSLFWVQYGDRSTCDYYVVETYLGTDQLNASPNYAELFAAVHPGKDIADAMAATERARQMVASSLWFLVDAVPAETYRHVTVNYMQVDDHEAYIRMETETFKPIHQAFVDGGHRNGWGLYSLISPGGNDLGYNFATVDLFNEFGPVPWAETLQSVHPDMDMESVNQITETTRDMVRTETWTLVAATKPPAD